MEKYITLYEQLMTIRSDTGTGMECDIANFIYDWFTDLDYFKKHPDHLNKHAIDNDPFGRSNVTALVRGKGSRTVILLHHHDAVDIFEYGPLMPYAFSSDELKEELGKMNLSDDIVQDLNDSQWLWGRGSCDMKASAAVQMELIKHYAQRHLSLSGNILFLSVCDEENMSVGMRHAVTTLNQYQKKLNLNYITAINSEPVSKDQQGRLKFYEGSVGKTMPVLYVRGKKSHIGDIFNGFNPMVPLSQMHLNIEHNPQFTDTHDGEVTPPPTWVYYRDQKKMYDVSIPESAVAYFSILSLHKSPEDIMSLLKTIGIEAFEHTIKLYEESVATYNQKSIEQVNPLSFKPLVYTFKELKERLVETRGDSVMLELLNQAESLKTTIKQGHLTAQEATVSLIEKALEYLEHQEPVMVLAFAAPIYPFVCNTFSKKEVPNFQSIINSICDVNAYQTYTSYNYFMGICDFSYMTYNMKDDALDYLKNNMPGWDTLYSLPIDDLKALDIPLLNIGPWGKDLHKITERVHKDNAFNVLPNIIMQVIEEIL